MGIQSLREKFKNPPRSYGPTPFWGLNDDLDPDRLRLALGEFADRGCAGVFMHARTGLEVPYLSEHFGRTLYLDFRYTFFDPELYGQLSPDLILYLFGQRQFLWFPTPPQARPW